MWRGRWWGRVALLMTAVQAAAFCALALWPHVDDPQAARAVAALRSEIWANSGLALLALMAMPLLAVLVFTLAGLTARLLAALALAAVAALIWLMSGEFGALIALREAPLELARGLVAARVQTAALAVLALAALIAARRASALA
jgi:hypothetical protein